MKEETSKILVLVTAKTKLDRDKGVSQLTLHIPTLAEEEILELEKYFSQLETLAAESASSKNGADGAEGAPAASGTWESLLGILNGAHALIISGKCGREIAESWIEPSMATLTHSEVRVREGVGRLLGAITAR